MYQQYPDFPRLDQQVPTLARLHMQDLHRLAGEVRLARLVAAHEKAAAPARRAVALYIWQMLRAGIRKAAIGIGGMGARSAQPVAAPDA
jgi:hypothetical protein